MLIYNTEKYDESLKALTHFQKFPIMLPFIGTEYDKRAKKLLIIAESHYLEKDTQTDIMKWYELDETLISSDDRASVDTRGVVEYHYPNHKTLFRKIGESIISCGFNPKDKSNMFKYVAFYNFFQRPAEEYGKTINPNPKDIKKAEETFEHIVETINPTHILFVSKKSWNFASKVRGKYKDRIAFGYSMHPSSPWWNRKTSQNVNGKILLEKFIKDYKIFE
jgi:hypothetical protein